MLSVPILRASCRGSRFFSTHQGFRLDVSDPSRPRLTSLTRNKRRSNVLLMGPPGSGKTSVGRIISTDLKKPVYDIDDDHLEKIWATTVADKLAHLGDDAFLEAEGQALMKLDKKDTIVSLSGSNPLHSKSMEHVARDGTVVFIDMPKDDILARCGNMKVDRIVGQKSSSLGDVLDKRVRVYENCYDVRVLCGHNESQDEIARKTLAQMKKSEKFVSTRGYQPGDSMDFLDVVRFGLAPDRGLFMAEQFIPFTTNELSRLLNLNYQERLLRVIERFPLGRLHPSELRDMIYSAYSTFTHPSSVLPVTPLAPTSTNNTKLSSTGQYLMETFHGPTASFKDLSLQLTPQILGHANSLASKTDRVGLLVATSGDTGTAALDGFSRLPNTPIIVLYPKDGVSPVQKRQMQTAEGHVCVIGVDADFDFCQTTVKDILNSKEINDEFRSIVSNLQLSSANSINWGRFLPQVGFSFSAYLDLVNAGAVRLGDPIDICIPTGNFGNILGAVVARRMGVPIRNLICASNNNNVLVDFINTGAYDLNHRSFHKTISPSIDILVSSNLERFLYVLSGGDNKLVSSLFGALDKDRRFQVSSGLLEQVQKEVQAGWCSEADCLRAIHDTFKQTGILIDPHTAVAKFVADKYQKDGTPMVISSTAHYAKFPQPMLHALGLPAAQSEDLPTLMSELRSTLPRNGIHPGIDSLIKKPTLHNTTSTPDKQAIIAIIKQFLAKFAQSLKK